MAKNVRVHTNDLATVTLYEQGAGKLHGVVLKMMGGRQAIYPVETESFELALRIFRITKKFADELDFALCVGGPQEVEELPHRDLIPCPACKENTRAISIPEHSMGLLHAVCEKCGFCEDCDEGNV